MNDKFDELAKGLAQSVTRRGALKKFGLGLAGIIFAYLGLANGAKADPSSGTITCCTYLCFGSGFGGATKVVTHCVKDGQCPQRRSGCGLAGAYAASDCTQCR